MIEKERKKIELLFSLLDDVSEHSANIIMAELLSYAENLPDWLQNFQESDSAIIRKRVHQLQAIMTIRQRRIEFARYLQGENNELNDDMIEALALLHLQWYDNDNFQTIKDVYMELLLKSRKFEFNTLNDVAYFMRKMKFKVSERNGLQPDLYCIGIVIDECLGADCILCALAKTLAMDNNLDLKIIKLVDNFSLMDENNTLLTPFHDWRTFTPQKYDDLQIWSDRKIIELISTRLFMSAVGSDSFRYVHTIGNLLAELIGEDNLNFLPYPYNS
ncbi:hypothetical protein AAEX28_14820 [Lentisphaerota bacterium WC36G]|nr:hypothetical protein LJT99_01575 [Lentisphaerae bacterium WC36]